MGNGKTNLLIGKKRWQDAVSPKSTEAMTASFSRKIPIGRRSLSNHQVCVPQRRIGLWCEGVGLCEIGAQLAWCSRFPGRAGSNGTMCAAAASSPICLPGLPKPWIGFQRGRAGEICRWLWKSPRNSMDVSPSIALPEEMLRMMYAMAIMRDCA